MLKKAHKTILKEFFDEYEWIHLVLGLLGNLMFFVGSVFFFWEEWKLAGIWLFVIGSFLMLIGSVGQAIVRYIERARRK